MTRKFNASLLPQEIINLLIEYYNIDFKNAEAELSIRDPLFHGKEGFRVFAGQTNESGVVSDTTSDYRIILTIKEK